MIALSPEETTRVDILYFHNLFQIILLFRYDFWNLVRVVITARSPSQSGQGLTLLSLHALCLFVFVFSTDDLWGQKKLELSHLLLK